MKLISMHVDDFGALHNYDYSFEEGLNVVLHDNGWGKTTMAAFLKAMLYGYDSKRSKDITENERKRYLPWQGGKYGGSLDFEAEGIRYRIYRTFGETPRFDTAKVVNLDTKTTARIPTDKIGEMLFHLDANAFQRSVFINQNGLSINGAASSIHARLNNLVSQANDVAAFDGAISTLTQEIKVYEKTGARGKLGDIARQISLMEKTRDQQEKVISEQDAARKRISELDILLSSINKELTEKKKRLDEVSGEEKRREAAQKLLTDIDGQIANLKKQIDAIASDLGGKVPSQIEIEQAKRQVQIVNSIKARIEELEALRAELSQEYSDLLAKYNGVLPTATELDHIQSIYGKIQGLASSDDTPLIEAEAPEDYVVIKAAAETAPDYMDRLQSTVDSQMDFQTMIHKLEAENRDLIVDERAWETKTKRYQNLKNEIERLQSALKEKEAYNPVVVDPIISKLEELQRKQQALDAKKEAISADLLTADQEAFLLDNAGDIPDVSEGAEILKKYRNVENKRSEIRGLTSRLEGERSKEESLATSLAQLESVPMVSTSAPEEPKRNSGSILLGVGAAIAVIGVILGIAITPALFAVAAVGGVLAVLGVININTYKNKLEAYNAWENEYAHTQETIRKREELLGQQNNVRATISSLEDQISIRQREIQSDEQGVSAWFNKWGSGDNNRSEERITQILERAEKLKKLRKKQEDTLSSRTLISTETAAVEAERKEIDLLYPEWFGKSASEAIRSLRSRSSAYRVLDGQLQTAIRNEEQFIKEAETTREQLGQIRSPKRDELQKKRDTTANELKIKIDNANQVLAALEMDTDQEHIVQAIREAGEMLNEYKRYADKLKDQAGRQNQKAQQIRELQNDLAAALAPLKDRYLGQEVPDRMALIREEIGTANQIKAKIADSDSELKRQHERLLSAEKYVGEFKLKYGHFSAQEEDILPEIYERVGRHTELTVTRQQLEKQRNSVVKDQQRDTRVQANEEEANLRAEVSRLTERRDNLLIEYTQKGDFIREADKALEKYPDTIQEIRALYDQKQKAQNRLTTLKRAIQLITKAKENLANRYLSKVEDLFNSYMHVWLNNEAVRGILDIDFNITIEENDKIHVAEGYSTGYCDLIDFCMRLALVDTLFEKEQPFLILDDPFVNLDADRLEKALELLSVMAANKQIVYFVCHPIRAVETAESTASRDEFLKLAEATKQTINKRQAGTTTKKRITRKSPKDMYRLSGTTANIPFKPAKPDYTITNSIFSMSFIPSVPGVMKDNAYELFFIDAVGHVLNDRQLIEVNNGKMSIDRVQFSLNTRDDSGNEYELMVRESGQEDYEVVARFPFRAKLAFAGTFNFDF